MPQKPLFDTVILNCLGTESGVDALIDLFYKQEELAISEEQKTDAILDGKKDSEQPETVTTTKETQDEFIEKTVQKCNNTLNRGEGGPNGLVIESLLTCFLIILICSTAEGWPPHGTHSHWGVRCTLAGVFNYG